MEVLHQLCSIELSHSHYCLSHSSLRFRCFGRIGDKRMDVVVQHSFRIPPTGSCSCQSGKLAFQGPDAIKWTYTVMPFGPTNGLAMFVNFIYDVDSQWKSLARTHAIDIGDDTNTRIIINDIVSYGKDLSTSLLYMECQLQVCMAHRSSLSLKKSFIFPINFKFVGNNVFTKGNWPA